MAYPLDVQPEPILTPPERLLSTAVLVEYTPEQAPDVTSDNYISGGLEGSEAFPGYGGLEVFPGGLTWGYCVAPGMEDPLCYEIQVPGVGRASRIASPGSALATFVWVDSESYWWFEPFGELLDEGEFEIPPTADDLGNGIVCFVPGLEPGQVAPISPVQPLGGSTVWDGGATSWDGGTTTWD